MEKLEEIKKVVMDNAKKGKLTTTKYVGPYQYKSGYDNYFSLSFDKEGNVIVYSLFKNDRGEHIDTDVVKLSDLDEKVLNEVYENINTKDQNIIDILEWYEKWEPSLYEHNTDILTYLGIIKPKEKNTKQKEIFVLDEKNIPVLKNKKDAYFITRSHKVGVLTYKGEVPKELSYQYSIDDPERIYEFTDPDECRGVITSSASYNSKEVFTFGCLDKEVKNKGCFAVGNDEKKSDDKYIFVKTKKLLIELFNEANKIEEEKNKYYYIINTNFINCFKTKEVDRFTEKHFIVFSDKNEALKKFEEIKKRLNKKLDDYLEKAEKLLEERIKLLGNNTREKEFYIDAYKLKVGDKFVANEKYKNVYTVAKKDGNKCIIYLEGGGVIHPYKNVLPYDKLEDIKIEREYSKLRENIRDIESFINGRERDKEDLNNYTPIIDDTYVFSVKRIEDRYKEILKTDFNINKSID